LLVKGLVQEQYVGMVLVVWLCLGGDLLGALLGHEGGVRVGEEKEDLTKTQPCAEYPSVKFLWARTERYGDWAQSLTMLMTGIRSVMTGTGAGWGGRMGSWME
jgi:hypothetical protein